MAPVELERAIRIKVSLAAYAYEFDDNPFMSDELFDKLCLAIDPSVTTGNTTMDRFFATEFEASTGMWIRKHPQLADTANLYRWLSRQEWPIGDGSRLLEKLNQNHPEADQL